MGLISCIENAILTLGAGGMEKTVSATKTSLFLFRQIVGVGYSKYGG
jgi:hypothetical protein